MFFQPYLRAIRQNYARWWEVYTVTDVQGREWQNVRVNEELESPASPFDFGLKVQTVTREEVQPKQREERREKIEQLPVLEGLRKYAFDEKTRHLLLVGRPGSGKSTDFFGETQPRISHLMNGEIERFTIDKLINLLAKAGMKAKVEVIPEFIPQK